MDELKPSEGMRMAEKLSSYDPAEDLGSDEAIAAFMAESVQTGDAAYVSHALGVVTRAKGTAQMRKNGLLETNSPRAGTQNTHLL